MRVTRSTARLRGALVFGVGLSLFVAYLGVGPASATVATCSYSAGTVTVTTYDETHDVTLKVGGAGEILANGVQCSGGATVTNTDKVFWDENSSGPFPTFTIDFSGGPFAPGATDEGNGTSEIEWDLNTELGCGEPVVLLGTSGNDTYIGGADDGPFPFDGIEDSWNFNDDEDADASICALLAVQGKGGHDTLSGLGGAGTGLRSTRPLTIAGQEGDDEVAGGSANDFLNGNTGADDLQGDGGNDVVGGGMGADVVRGGQGQDEVNGGKGNDGLIGGNGADTLNGGPNTDSCTGGGGFDTVANCESGQTSNG